MRFILFLLTILPLFTVGTVSAQDNSLRLRALDFAPFEEALAAFSAERAAEIDLLVVDATVLDVQAAMAAGELTSEELTLYFLDRIRRYDETLRSTIELNPNALEEARAADALRAEGTVLGALHGIPVNLKDNIETTAPMHTTGGAEILLDHVPVQDAPLVAQLREAGAVILGKASLSELAGAVTSTQPGANAISGAGVNPYGAAFSTAGSSSGSGISSSAYLTMVSVGTETSGSLIAPAAFNGNVGMKPSRDLVSGAGIIPLISYQDSAGPIARSVTDAAVLLSVIDTADVDYAAGLDANALDGVSVGILRDDILAQAPLLEDTSDNEAMLTRIDAGLGAANAVTIDIPTLTQPDITPSLIFGLAFDTINYLADAEVPIQTLADLQAYNAAMPEQRIPFMQNFIDLAVQAVPALLEAANATEADMGNLYEGFALANRAEAETALAAAFADSGVEMLVSLTNVHSQLYATAGYPAITVPLGLRQNGMPTGVTFIGKRGEDAQLLAYAYAFEQATKLRVNPALDGTATAAVDFVDVQWQWQEFQSMDGSATVVSNPENYTLVFNADGTFNIQADCNQGSGSYTVEEASLSITIGALTRAACPPDSLSDRYVELLGFAASYVIEEGDLYLSLLAVGGILRFSPAAQDDDFGALYTTETVPCPDFIVNGEAFNFNPAANSVYGELNLPTEIEGETYSCGVVVVPENYDEPDGRTLELFYLKLHSFSQSPAPDPLVYLAGGPGSSGAYETSGNPALLANLNPIRERRDIIAYDQRGTGFSNFLLCAPFESAIGILQEQGDNPDVSAPLDALQADGGLGYFALKQNLCSVVARELAGVDLGQYNSVVSAQDIAHVVETLGYTEGYNLYGTSYGTRLAQYAMRGTPDHIRSVVMDGVTSPAIHNVVVTFASYFEPYRALFAQCEADAACNAAYPDLAERFGRLLAELEAAPLVFDPPLVLNPQLAATFKTATLSQIDPNFFTKLASLNNRLVDGGIARSVPRIILAVETGDTAYLAALMEPTAQAVEGQLGTSPSHEDDMERVQADQPLFQLPFDALLVAARNEAADADPGIDTQWLAIVLEDFRTRLLAGEDQADLMLDLLNLSVLPNTGTTAQVLTDFADAHLSPSAAETANAVVAQMTRNDVRSTLWHVQDVAMTLGAEPDQRADSSVLMLAVNCADETDFSSLEVSQAYLDASPYPQLLLFPIEVNEAYLKSCLSFPTTLDESVMDPVVSDIPALLFLGQLDTQTPVTWGRFAAEGLSSDFVVEWNNTGHVVAGHDLHVCAGDIAAAFLDDPTREPNISCSQSERYRLQFEMPE